MINSTGTFPASPGANEGYIQFQFSLGYTSWNFPTRNSGFNTVFNLLYTLFPEVFQLHDGHFQGKVDIIYLYPGHLYKHSHDELPSG